MGGPWITVQEDYFEGLVDAIFVGEAEETWPQFLEDWKAGCHQPRYEQKEKSDMTKVPCPRYDLVPMEHYVFGSLQISRGCPFQCEFCDIIVTFGRRPRLKRSEQVLKELESLQAQGLEIAFIVDDNLIGNKKAIRPVLEAIVEWQRERGFPFIFFAEASLDLADDPELMELFIEANIQAIFVGVESPNAASLQETKKLQNLRPGGTIAEKIHRIQAAGMEVWTGMIVGFDHDDETIFDQQLEFLKEARVIHAMFGMLAAIPKTPLHERLVREHRLDFADRSEFGTNVIPLKMSREALRDGYRRCMQELTDPRAFFDRVDSLYLNREFVFDKAQRKYWKKHPIRGGIARAKQLLRGWVIYRRLMRQISDPNLKNEYRFRLKRLWKTRKDPAAYFVYALKCATHYHYHKLAQDLQRQELPLVNSF